MTVRFERQVTSRSPKPISALPSFLLLTSTADLANRFVGALTIQTTRNLNKVARSERQQRLI